MNTLPNLYFSNLYEQAYSNTNDLKAIESLRAIYTMRLKLVDAFTRSDRKTIANIVKLDCTLGKALGKAIIIDETVLSGEEDLPIVPYKIDSHPVKFKIESGNRISVADAINIEWDADHQYLATVYESYNNNKPKGPLTKEKLAKLPEEFHETDFGTVRKLDLVIEKAKKDSGGQDKIITIKKDLKVIGITNPKIGGQRKEMRPIVQFLTQGPGLEKGSLQSYALTDRGDNKYRVLAGADLLKQAGISILYGDHDNHYIDQSMVDLEAINKCLAPVLKT